MKNIPKKIYLQLGDDDLDEWPSSDFNSLSVVTWCEDMQHDSDIEYVLAQDIERGVVGDEELINEILTKYMEWSSNTAARSFIEWEEEEGDFEKTKARIRKEFIEFFNKQNKSK